jgi:hypothetical protein
MFDPLAQCHASEHRTVHPTRQIPPGTTTPVTGADGKHEMPLQADTFGDPVRVPPQGVNKTLTGCHHSVVGWSGGHIGCYGGPTWLTSDDPLWCFHTSPPHSCGSTTKSDIRHRVCHRVSGVLLTARLPADTGFSGTAAAIAPQPLPQWGCPFAYLTSTCLRGSGKQE